MNKHLFPVGELSSGDTFIHNGQQWQITKHLGTQVRARRIDCLAHVTDTFDEGCLVSEALPLDE